MCIKSKHFLTNREEIKEKLEVGYVDTFILRKIENADDFCAELSKQIKVDAFWYLHGQTALICVNHEYVKEAIAAGKLIITNESDDLSAEYLTTSKLSVFDDYHIIATFETSNMDDLKKWCKDIDAELLVKSNSVGQKVILTNELEPDDVISRMKRQYESNPFPGLLNFDYSSL